LPLDTVAVRLQEFEAPRRQSPGRDSFGRSGVYSKETRVTDFVQRSEDRVEVDSAGLPQSQIPRDCSSAWRSRNWRGWRNPHSAPTGSNDAGFDAGLLRAG